MNNSFWKCLAVVLVMVPTLAVVNAKVEQIHLSLGTDETEMVVTWTDPDHEAKEAKVYYGVSPSSLDVKVNAVRQSFKEGHTKFYTFRALLSDLKPGTTYHYQIKTETKKSETLKFKTLPKGSEWLPRFAIYGDLGYVNEKSLPYLTKDVQKDLFDVIFHIGDFAYDLDDNHGETGHNFMRSIEPVSSRVPYMTCPGNHERHDNFSHYDARFTMIGDRQDPDYQAPIDERLNNHFHSMDIGPAHIIMFSTEYYYYTEYGWEQIERQYQWLEEDLKRAQQNRQERPWIIAMGHRPLYCLKMGDSSCNHETLEREDIRKGIHMHDKGERQFGLEELFHKYGVDLQFYGHEHFYARLLPLYQFKIKNGTKSHNPYDHADGPIHVTTGSAGNKELHPAFNHLKNWVAHHFYDYGYTRLTFVDKYHIHIEQVSDDQGGKVLDEFDILKSSANPHWMLPLDD